MASFDNNQESSSLADKSKTPQSEIVASPSAVYQIHNLDTVAEENEDPQKATTGLCGWTTEYLVEDSTRTQLSAPLARLLAGFIDLYQNERELNSFDMLFVAIYCISLEMGFLPDGHRIQDQHSVFQPRYASYDRRVMRIFSDIVPTDFYDRTNRSYRLNLYMPGSEEQCSLVGVGSGDFLCLTFTVPKRADISGKSTLLSVSRYVPVLNFRRLNLTFQNLKELSQRLKNELFIPVRDVLCLDEDIPIYPSLNGLPDEVVASLLVRYLDKNSSRRLAATCSRLKALATAYCEK
ncbi:uncharacterized protein LOC129751487 [Uranotaenia lowii]|uniref:uncharacterized protein LOC129751487 n=1 Tax=Uranotaenia lowii TaxID=190385 RepID=UPI002479761E|nr:uncharacterized protein LOC129751487 [Uranotaenia lowii]